MIAASVRVCRICQKDFTPFLSLQVVCGLRCARRVAVMGRNALKAERKAIRERLDGLRPLSYWTKQAQTAFNAWIRHRDEALPCVSCGTATAKQWHAGHYLTTGARPELRFDELNVHKQCSQCNEYLSGNLVNYRIELIRRIGLAEVEWLEGPHEPKRYRADDLRAIRDWFRAMLKVDQKESA